MVDDGAKKKRGAAEQLTKDGVEARAEEDDGVDDYGGRADERAFDPTATAGVFKKASAQEMKGRRIVRARRKAIAPLPEEKLLTLTEEQKKKDPFASAQTLAKEQGEDGKDAADADAPAKPANPFAGISFSVGAASVPAPAASKAKNPFSGVSFGFGSGGAAAGGFGAFNKQQDAGKAASAGAFGFGFGAAAQSQSSPKAGEEEAGKAKEGDAEAGAQKEKKEEKEEEKAAAGTPKSGTSSPAPVVGGFGSAGGFGAMAKNAGGVFGAFAGGFGGVGGNAGAGAAGGNGFSFGSGASAIGAASASPGASPGAGSDAKAVAIGQKDEDGGNKLGLEQQETVTGEESEESVFKANAVFYE